MKLLRTLLLLLLVPSARGQQYPFLPVPGAPKVVKRLFQDSRGRLWLGGPELFCFDGARFFSLRDYGMPAGESYDISEDPSGAIWIGAENGIYRFAEGRVEEVLKGAGVSVIEPSPDMAVAAVGPAGKGILNKVSLVRMQRDDKSWKSEKIVDLDSNGPITLDHSGMLLYPMPGKGWQEIRLTDVVNWHAGQQLPITSHLGRVPSNGPISLMRDRAGCLWWGSSRGGYYFCPGRTENGQADLANLSPVMHEAPDGTMLVVGNSKIVLGRPGSIQAASRANGLPGVADAIIAKDGTIWMGDSGLYRFPSPFRIEYWTIREGLPDPPFALTRSGNTVYAGLERRIVTLTKDRQRWETLTTFDSGGSVSNMVPDKDGNIVATFIDRGIVEVSPQGKILARAALGHPACCSMRLTKTPDGEIWVNGSAVGKLTRAGSLLRYDEHVMQKQPSGNGLAIKYEERTRRLWGCYNGGLVVRDERDHWKEFSTSDGLTGNGCWGLAPLPSGDLWYAYYNLGVIAHLRLDETGKLAIIRQYDASTLRPESGGDTLDADSRGWLWRGGEQGFYVADEGEAEAANWLQMSITDGFPANGMNTGSVFADTDGSMWWGADNDLAHYIPPQDLIHPAEAPAVFVSAFSLDGGAPRLAEAVDRLPHGSKIIAHIGSLQFERRNALKIRYRVLPEQSAWRETSDLDLALGSLGWGSHSLEVQGKVFTSPWSETVRTSFKVGPPLLLTRPFLITYPIVLAGILAFYLFYYRPRMLKRASALPELASWRLAVLSPEIQELVGTALDSRYQVGERLARGGFANVMRGLDIQENRPCAIKIFRSEVSSSESLQRRFEQEVSALQQVRHPNVVSIYAHGKASSGVPYLVMEFVEGQSLREILNDGPFAPARAANLLRQLAAALEAIHSKGICHRDVKPENVMIRDAGAAGEQIILIDFSISIVQDADESLHGVSRAAGTFEYMAPEQAIGYAQPSSDIYSLARLLIEMLTGTRLATLLPNASMDLPVRVRELLATLPIHLSEASVSIISSSLEFDPARRPASVTYFAASIVEDLASQPERGDEDLRTASVSPQDAP